MKKIIVSTFAMVLVSTFASAGICPQTLTYAQVGDGEHNIGTHRLKASQFDQHKIDDLAGASILKLSNEHAIQGGAVDGHISCTYQYKNKHKQIKSIQFIGYK
jgi:major membrane immunogen (membrane-anchored lipoprotein)